MGEVCRTPDLSYLCNPARPPLFFYLFIFQGGCRGEKRPQREGQGKVFLGL